MTRQVQTILVADDEWEVRELVRTILEWEDYAVVEAKDGEDALAQARAGQPDLILLDVRMPKMNGLDVLEHLQADPALASIPVVMLSVLTNYPQVGTALRNGAVAYLPKPFEIPDLARMVKRVLTGDAARREVIRQHAVKSLIELW
jgi:CheY-like chemotaxis protein